MPRFLTLQKTLARQNTPQKVHKYDAKGHTTQKVNTPYQSKYNTKDQHTNHTKAFVLECQSLSE